MTCINMLSKILDSQEVQFGVMIVTIISLALFSHTFQGPVKSVLEHKLFVSSAVFAFAYIHTRNLTASSILSIAILVVAFLNAGIEGFTILPVQKTAILPGCRSTTVKDLLDLFEGNEKALKEAMYKAEVPLNLALTDDNAPLIASYLVYYGNNVSSDCRKPI